MKERFEPIVIPDAFASEGLGETVVATQPQPGCDVVTISIGDEHVGYTPDEARAIGRALIAAADHIQQRDLYLHVGKSYFGEDKSVWKIVSSDDDPLVPMNGVMVKRGKRKDLSLGGIPTSFTRDGRCLIEEDDEDYTGNTTVRDFTNEGEGVHLVREAV